MIHIFLNGDFVTPLLPLGAGDFCVAVDGGMRHAKALGWAVDVWLGDFDSSTLDEQSALFANEILSFSPEKAETDFELALRWVRERFPNQWVQVLGAWGDELDHSLANVLVLPNSGLGKMVLVSAKQQLWFMAGQSALKLAMTIGATVSILPLTKLEGVCSRGLRWGLQDDDLEPFLARSCRNEATAEVISVSWQAGAGLVIAPR